jgi:hypothetical protein
VAELLIVPGAIGVIVTVALPPLTMPPRLHDTVFVPEHEPWLGLSEPNCTLAGRVSVTTTFVAFDDPALLTPRV